MTFARLDDLSAAHPSSWEFHVPVANGRAERLDDVIDVMHEAERQAHAGAWVILVVAYEAAGAFDRAMVTKATPPAGTPLLWWASFAQRRCAQPLEPVASPVVERRRRVGTQPYTAAVEAIRRRIADGDVYQVNMTERFDGSYAGEPIDLYAALLGVQSCSHGAFVDMGDRVVASVSPELFFRVDGDVVTCRPMKGTAPRHPRTEADRATGAALTVSSKERAENVMIVDLLRNDLSRVARLGTVRVPRLFQLERYETVWQLTSTVSAELEPATGLVELMSALFPCGSITGAPKIAAMGIIDELEQDARGVYCGAIGVLAPPGHQPRIECSVPIRTAVLDPIRRTFVYGAGGGITWLSDPVAEDDEVRAKARILNRSHRTFRILETLRLDGSGPRNLELHLERMAASADWFSFAFDRPTAAAMLAPLRSTGRAERLRVLLGAGGSLDVERVPLGDDEGAVSLALDTEITRSDDPFCCHKTTYRRHYDEARARHPEADDVVLVNEHGRAVECTIANLAFRIGSAWFVTPLDDGGLPGIARAIALRDGVVSERSIAASDLRRCDELAVVNDLRGWRPAVLG